MELFNEYETTVILRPDLGGASIEKNLDRIRSVVAAEGKMLNINHWGQKRLAYEIEKHRRGIYVHTHYLGRGPMVSEIERGLRLSEDVLRFLTVKLDQDLTADSRESTDYVAPDYDKAAQEPAEAAPEAPAAEAAPAEAAAEETAPAASEEPAEKEAEG